MFRLPHDGGNAAGKAMKASEFLATLGNKIAEATNRKTIPDSGLAKWLCIQPPSLAAYWRRKNAQVTPRMVLDLIRRREGLALANAIKPVIEFFYLDPIESKQGAKWELFTPNGEEGEHPYLAGLKARLSQAHGIYIFHDSRGRAIYVGKAIKQDLWKEMNFAFNRDRGEVQSIKRVGHPEIRVKFKPDEAGRRPIKREAIPLHEIASYVSAYEIAGELIGVFEALLVRSFANDLLNVRMENLG